MVRETIWCMFPRMTKRPEVETGMEETGKEGKLRKERETRDGERALRDVEEMERSEEEFVKEMEVTRTQSSYYKKRDRFLILLLSVTQYCSHSATKHVEAEEKRTNLRLREEQNAAYRASLEADQARESQRQEEEERLEREAAEAERKRKEEEEAQERAEREAVERETDRVRMRPEKVLAVGDDPEKVPDVAHVSSPPFLCHSLLSLFCFCWVFTVHVDCLFAVTM
ncbi:unnamed protein product [Brassica oleracea]|uniref:(rape) hypothetical protein n=1 Tax=Brassica napus TaxID=3708 RepID=A0A816JF34_BRANA|nr:unnamed protein product [Brassica napus]